MTDEAKKKGRQNNQRPLRRSPSWLACASLLLQFGNLGECLSAKFSDDQEIGWTETLGFRPLPGFFIFITILDGRVVHRAVFGLVRPDGQFDATVFELGDGAVSRLWCFAG